MENFLLILAVVGGLIYKIYENYKEEMEKARKRKAQMPSRPNSTLPPQGSGEHRPPTEPRQPVPHAEPVFPQKETRERLQKTAETSRNDIKDLRHQLDDIRVKTTAQRAHEEAAERMERDRNRRLAFQGRKDTEQQLEVVDLDYIDFDLRKAIIQSAILERPYKD